MKASFDARHLDVDAFAKANESLHGEWPMASLARLAASFAPDAPPTDTDRVQWQLTGEHRQLRGSPSEIWLHLHAQASVRLDCQRCLKAVEAPLDVERSFLFVHGEETAAALDAESDDDVLALTRSLDTLELLEDELLLALPLVPRHAVCPEPLPVPDDELPEASADEHPFAALAALKRGNLPN